MTSNIGCHFYIFNRYAIIMVSDHKIILCKRSFSIIDMDRITVLKCKSIYLRDVVTY